MWWFSFQFKGQKIQESAMTTSKSVARDAQRNRRRELEEGVNGIRREERALLFSTAAEKWLAVGKGKRGEWSANTLTLYKLCLSHLKPFFGGKLIFNIEPGDIEVYQRARRREGASGRTVNMETSILRQVLKKHKCWTRLGGDFKPEAERENIGRALSDEQEKKLLKAAASRKYGDVALYPIVVLGLNTAMRRDEVRKLQWKQVSLEGHTLAVGKAKTQGSTGRRIPLNSTTVAVLEMWQSRFPHAKPEHYIFPANEHHHTDPTRPLRSFRTAWRAATREAGLPGLRFHDLRHHVITKLAEGLASEQTIMAIAGHLSKRMLERYSHIRMEAKRKALDAIATEEIDAGYLQKSLQSEDRGKRAIQ